MSCIDTGNDLATRIRLIKELGQDGKEEVIAVLLMFVTKIAIIIGHGRGSCLTSFDNIFDYCGAGQWFESVDRER
jgi:hypothetical protein